MPVVNSSSSNQTSWSCKFCNKHFVLKNPFEVHEKYLCKQSDKPRTQKEAQEAALLLNGYIQSSQLKLHKNTAEVHGKLVQKIGGPASKAANQPPKKEVNIVISSDEEDEDENDKSKSNYSRIVASRQVNQSNRSQTTPVIVQGNKTAQGRTTASNRPSPQGSLPQRQGYVQNKSGSNLDIPSGVSLTNKSSGSNNVSRTVYGRSTSVNNAGNRTTSTTQVNNSAQVTSRTSASAQMSNAGRSLSQINSLIRSNSSQASNAGRGNSQISNANRNNATSHYSNAARSNSNNQISNAVRNGSSAQSSNARRSAKDDSDDDDDIVLTSVDPTTIDPITRKQIVDPVKNKICNHVYEKSTILESIELAMKNKKPVRCPYFGCQNRDYKKSDLVKDKTVTEYCEKARKAKAAEAANEEQDDDNDSDPKINITKNNVTKNITSSLKTNQTYKTPTCDLCKTSFANHNLLRVHIRVKHANPTQNSIPMRTLRTEPTKRLSNSLYDDSDSDRDEVTRPMPKRRPSVRN